MLKIRNNKKKVKFFNDTVISTGLKNVLLNMPKISTIDYNNLTDDEKDIIHVIIQDTDINLLRYNQSKIDNLINKYNILKGELLIGNNNPQLLKDLKLVILQLVNHNIITLKDISPILEAIFVLI